MSLSVLRRYTPPTCTLEIMATGSVLSRWTDRTVLKNLRFELSFDDPKLPADQQVMVRGDRVQLDALYEAVESYVQEFLRQPAPVVVGSAEFHTALSEEAEATPESATVSNIFLQSKGLLAHELHLGSLANGANGESGSPVALTALQLFDLANALDEYHAEALSLPTLGRPAWLNSPAGWAKIAAMLVLSLGITGAIAKFVVDISSPVSQVATNRDAEMSLASEPTDDSRLPVPALPSPQTPTDLTLEPVFPPKPPAEAVQPSLAPPANASSPPAGVTVAPSSVPLNQLPVPSSGTATQAPSSDVVIVPEVVPGENPGVVAQLPEADAARSTSDLAAGSALESRVATLSPNSAVPGQASPEAYPETSSVATNRTAFDTYPQIAEVRRYFQENWQPPEELMQTLEYRLVLNAEGRIQQIIPLGEASGQFVDRTRMPLMGEPFVSPLQDRSQLQVRLVLRPDGAVQTFADGNQ